MLKTTMLAYWPLYIGNCNSNYMNQSAVTAIRNNDICAPLPPKNEKISFRFTCGSWLTLVQISVLFLHLSLWRIRENRDTPAVSKQRRNTKNDCFFSGIKVTGSLFSNYKFRKWQYISIIFYNILWTNYSDWRIYANSKVVAAMTILP